MLFASLVFLVIAMLSALFAFTGVAGTATDTAWVLFTVSMVMAFIFATEKKRPY